MTPCPKISATPPHRWIGTVALWPNDIEVLLKSLPKGAPVVDNLRSASETAEQMATRLSLIDRGEEEV